MAQASAISGLQMSTRDPKLQSNLADAATPTVIAEELGGNARSKVNKETGLAPDS